MAIIKFSKVGPAAQAPGSTAMLGAQIDLMKAQRGAASMQAALGAVQLGDAVMQSKPLNAAVNELKMRGGQLYDWATDKPPSPAEERIRLRREAAGAAADAGTTAEERRERLARAPGAIAAADWGPTFDPTAPGGVPAAAPPTMYDKAVEAISGGAARLAKGLDDPRVRAMGQMHRGALPSLARAAAGPDPVFGTLSAMQGRVQGQRQMALLDAAAKHSGFGQMVADLLPSSKAAAKVAPYVTPASTPVSIAVGKVDAMLGASPSQVAASVSGGAEGSAGEIVRELEGLAMTPLAETFKSGPAGAEMDPKRALGLGITQAERAAGAVSPQLTGQVKAQTKRAELFEITRRLDEARRTPGKWPPINPKTKRPYDIDNMELGGLVLLAQTRPLGPDQIAELVVLARERAVSDGLLDIAGGKYKDEAAEQIYEAQKAWHSANPPLDLVKAAGQIAKMDRQYAFERKLVAETEEVITDTYWANNMGQAKTYNLWMKYAMSPTGRKYLLRGGIKRAGGGRRANSLTLGWDLKKSIEDTSSNDGGKSNHELYTGLLAMGHDKDAKAAIAGLRTHYDIQNAGQKMEDTVESVNAKLAIMRQTEARLAASKTPQSKAYKLWAKKAKLLDREWQAILETREGVSKGAEWVDPPRLGVVANSLKAIERKLLEHTGREPAVNERTPARRPGASPTKAPETTTRPAGVPAGATPVHDDEGKIIGWKR